LREKYTNKQIKASINTADIFRTCPVQILASTLVILFLIKLNLLKVVMKD